MKKKKELELRKRMEMMQSSTIRVRRNSTRSLSLMSSMMRTHRLISRLRSLKISIMIITSLMMMTSIMNDL
jgi:hypothetical protein